MEEMQISKFKATCLAVLARVGKTGNPVLVTRFGKPVAQIVPPPSDRSGIARNVTWPAELRNRRDRAVCRRSPALSATLPVDAREAAAVPSLRTAGPGDPPPFHRRSGPGPARGLVRIAPLFFRRRMGTRDRIEAVLESIRPAIRSDGGDVELVGWNEAQGRVEVRLMGACEACPISMFTLKEGIEQRLRASVPEVLTVEAH